MRVARALREEGFVRSNSRELGLPNEAIARVNLSHIGRPDPRGPGKRHARDSFHYDLREDIVMPAPSIAAHDGTDDYARFELPSKVARTIITLFPNEYLVQNGIGKLSADYFSYDPGVEVGLHQDGFGTLVAIWVLWREDVSEAAGGKTTLELLDGEVVLWDTLVTGEVLIFRDDMFRHGMTTLQLGRRDALIFIANKSEAVDGS